MINSTKKSKIISWLMLILWMAVIFYLSHQPSSDSKELSLSVMSFLKDSVSAMIPVEWDAGLFHHLIRKGAHFTAYFLLGMLSFNAMQQSNVAPVSKNSLWALIICILYAISDETHQLFVPGRSGEIKDVIIDSAGSLTGILFYIVIYKLLKKSRDF